MSEKPKAVPRLHLFAAALIDAAMWSRESNGEGPPCPKCGDTTKIGPSGLAGCESCLVLVEMPDQAPSSDV